ncbi:MAG: hypothetical protein U5K75_03160 [Ahrensia sp.]|nr:hypothetical protein [Ahrensia sp.]
MGWNFSFQSAVIAAFVIDTKLYDATFFVGVVLATGYWRWRVSVGYHEEKVKFNAFDLHGRAQLASIWEDKYLLPSVLMAANIGFLFLQSKPQ